MTGARGFTLVELMVAITGGLFLSIAVFVLARDGSRFYQRESRVANATLAGIVGFERLRADLTRAGFLASPNIRHDRNVCSAPAGGSWVGQMASLRITPKGSPSNETLAANKVFPDRIVLAGSFASADQFPIRCVVDTGSAYEVFLQKNSGAMARLGYLDAQDPQTLLGTLFSANRVLRIVDKSGMQHFAVISGASVSTGEPVVILQREPALRFRGTGGLCGLKGCETGALANVVNFIQYDVRNLAKDSNLEKGNPGYAALYSDAGVPGDDERTDLVRVEIDANGDYVADTEELVAEYAVNLKFGLTVAENFANGTDPSLRTLLADDGEIGNFAGEDPNIARPEHVRAIRVALSVRSREADREGNIPDAVGLYRIGIGPGGGAPFARVRTLQADIAMRNQMGATW